MVGGDLAKILSPGDTVGVFPSVLSLLSLTIEVIQDDMRKDRDREEVTRVLSNLLADEYLLSTKTKNYHWNVTGPHFNTLHQLFEDQYKTLDKLIDQIGERVRVLNGHAPGTMTEFLRCTRLQERPGVHPDEWTMVEDLYDDHEVLLRSLGGTLASNEKLRCDFGTTDFLASAIQHHETMAWMLRAVLEKSAHLKEWVKQHEEMVATISSETT